jgi:hypothetical protein
MLKRCGLNGGVIAVNGWVRAASFERDIARRHRAFLDRKHRRAGLPIEHEQHSALRRLQHDRHRTIVARDRDERGGEALS